MIKSLSQHIDCSFKRAFGWDAFIHRGEDGGYQVTVFLLIKGHYFDCPITVSERWEDLRKILGDTKIGPDEFYRLSSDFTSVVNGPFTWEEVKVFRSKKLENYRELTKLRETEEVKVG